MSFSMARDGRLSKLGVGSRSPAAWSAREIESAGAGYACSALAQISPPSAAQCKSLRRIEIGKKVPFEPRARGSRSPAAWSAREIEFASAEYACSALAQISPPSAAHFLKSYQLLVQKFVADRNRQKGPLRTASQGGG